jgi:hypothetical protein
MSEPNNEPSASDKTRIKRLRLKLRHLSEELEQAEELAKAYESQFQGVVSKLQVSLGLKEPEKKEPEKKDVKKTQGPQAPKDNPSFKKQNNQQSSNNEKEEDIRREVENNSASAPSWMKKLYKQIAMKTHPDRVAHQDLSPYEKAEYKRLFDTAKQAIQDSHGGELVYAAEALGINPDISPSMRISLLAARGEKIKTQIIQIYKKPSWVWGESYHKPEVRKKMLEGFCKIYKLKLPSKTFLDEFLQELKE